MGNIEVLESPFKKNVINPMREIIAYESLWEKHKASFKSISHLFKNTPGSKPSDFVSNDDIERLTPIIREILQDLSQEYKPHLLINGSFDYPTKLKDARYPIQVLYYSGDLGYLQTRCIAIVGTRKPTDEGVKRARKMAKLLVEDGFTIVSGLAEGIDTAAHTATIEAKGRTIAVIGTPLDTFYPKTNTELQKSIAREHLLLSQVPFYSYKHQSIFQKRTFFPERNVTMSALTEATIIIEAGQTSGTLIQATAAIQQGRKLFILDSCFQNKDITWPEKYLKLGAIRVKDYNDIKSNLEL